MQIGLAPGFCNCSWAMIAYIGTKTQIHWSSQFRAWAPSMNLLSRCVPLLFKVLKA